MVTTAMVSSTSKAAIGAAALATVASYVYLRRVSNIKKPPRSPPPPNPMTN